MELLYVLLVLLIFTRAFGEFSDRFGQPPLVGELLAGVVLGLVVQTFEGSFPSLSGVTSSEAIGAITDLGVFFLMLLAGIETHPSELGQASRRALPVAIAGMVLPFLLGSGLGWWFLPASPFRLAQALFLGVALAITAVPVSVKVLMDLGVQDTMLGRVVVSAAIIDDIMSLILLAVLTAVIATGSVPDLSSLLVLLGKVALFLGLTYVLGARLFPLVGRWVKRMRGPHVEFSALIGWGLVFAVLAELLSMHFVVGAFAAGLYFVRQTFDPETFERLEEQVRALTLGFFAPVFFASIGFHLDLQAVVAIPLFLMLLLAAAFAGKFLGAGLSARAVGFTARESVAIGAGMNARGAVELIIADVALRANLFDHPQPVPPIVGSLFSAVVIVAVVTTIVSPLILRAMVARER